MKLEKRFLLPAVVAIILIILPFANPSDFVIRLLMTTFVYAALAVNWNLIGGYTGYFSFGQTTFFGIGAYTAALLLKNYKLSPFLTAPVGGILAMSIAVGIGMISLRLRGGYFAISTYILMLATSEVIINTPELTQGGKGIPLAIPEIGTGLFLAIVYYFQLAFLVLSVLLVWRIMNSKFGLAIASIRENENAAEAVGVNTVRYKTYAYAISAFIPAMVGSVWAYEMSYIWPTQVFDIGVEMTVILMVIIGGVATIAGPLIGAPIIIILREILRLALFESGPLYLIIFGCLLVVVVILMPEGIVRKFARGGG